MTVKADPARHAAWAVLDRQTGGFVGMVSSCDRQWWNRPLAVGWIPVPGAQGRGLMTEAMGAVLGHCFTGLEVHHVAVEIEPENERSSRLAGRLDFTRDGLLRDRLQVGVVAGSVVMWSLLRTDRR